MRHLLVFLALSSVFGQSSDPAEPKRLPSVATRTETLDAFGYRWLVPVRSDWRVDGTSGENQVLHLLVERPPQGSPRRPTQFAVADTPTWESVTFEAEVLPGGGSLIVVFAFKDANHYNYAHLSQDPATKIPRAHNGIFHVFDADRGRISAPAGPPSLAAPKRWHKVVLRHDSRSGEVNVTVDGKAHPALRAVDLSLGPGKVGLGSFGETASFRRVRISGTTASQ
jgi:hypothetical protein